MVIFVFLKNYVSCCMKNDFEGSKNGFWEVSEDVIVVVQMKDDGGNRNGKK